MTFLRRIFDMIGIKRAAQGARDEFRKAARELQSAVADADETVWVTQAGGARLGRGCGLGQGGAAHERGHGDGAHARPGVGAADEHH